MSTSKDTPKDTPETGSTTTKDAPETGPTTKTFEEAMEAGYLGTVPDPEPNESYTLAGVTSEARSKASASSSGASSSSSKSSGSKASSA